MTNLSNTVGCRFNNFTDQYKSSIPINSRGENRYAASRETPAWQILSRGLNLQAQCANLRCQAHRQVVWIQKGLGAFDIVDIVFQRTLCPACNQPTEDITNVGLVDCAYRATGLQTVPERRRLQQQGVTPDFYLITFQNSEASYVELEVTATDASGMIDPGRIAFRKTDWEYFFGDVGPEPELPDDLHTILGSPCPFKPNKQIRETHMLFMVPVSVGGQPLTYRLLGELVQRPLHGEPIQDSGFRIGHRLRRGDRISVGTDESVIGAEREEFLIGEDVTLPREAQSTWILMNRDSIKEEPETRIKYRNVFWKSLVRPPLRVAPNREENEEVALSHNLLPSLFLRDPTIGMFIDYFKFGRGFYGPNTDVIAAEDRVRRTVPLAPEFNEVTKQELSGWMFPFSIGGAFLFIISMVGREDNYCIGFASRISIVSEVFEEQKQ